MTKKRKNLIFGLIIIVLVIISIFIFRRPVTLNKEFEKTKFVTTMDVENGNHIELNEIQSKGFAQIFLDKKVRKYSISPAISGRRFSGKSFDTIILFLGSDLTIYFGGCGNYIEDSYFRYSFEDVEEVQSEIRDYINDVK